GPLVQMASRVEAITRQLLTIANQTYRGPDEDPGAVGAQPSSGDLNGNTPGVFGLFDFTFTGTKDADGDGLAELSDLTTTGKDNFSSLLTFGVTDPRAFAAERDLNLTPGALSFPPGDGQSAQLVAGLRNSTFTFSAGSFSLTGTFGDAANNMTTYIGNQKA